MNIKKIFKNLLISLGFLIINYVLGLFEIPLMNNMIIIRFTYIVGMLYALHFNIYWCVGFAIVADILPFLISPPDYPFFAGYTVSAVLSIALYRYFLYRDNTNFMDILLCKLCVNTLVNMLLGAVWIYILYSGAGTINHFGLSLIKNLVLAPIEAGIFYLIHVVINKDKRIQRIINKLFN